MTDRISANLLDDAGSVQVHDDFETNTIVYTVRINPTPGGFVFGVALCNLLDQNTDPDSYVEGDDEA